MTDYTTIRVTETAKAKAEESKRDDETWNEYIQRCTDNPPVRKEFVDAGEVAAGGVSYDDVRAACAAAIEEELEGLAR